MKTNSLITAGAVIALVTLGTVSRANLIYGIIDVSVPISISGDLGTATGANLSGPGFVTYTSGTYSGIPVNTPVSFAPFISWTPADTPVDLWEFTAGPAWTYSFRITSMSIMSQSSTNLELAGGAIAFITGATSTNLPSLANWSISIIQDPGSNTGYTLNFYYPRGGPHGPQVVPDGGTTLLLLGVALSGLGLFRRKLAFEPDCLSPVRGGRAPPGRSFSGPAMDEGKRVIRGQVDGRRSRSVGFEAGRGGPGF